MNLVLAGRATGPNFICVALHRIGNRGINLISQILFINHIIFREIPRPMWWIPLQNRYTVDKMALRQV